MILNQNPKTRLLDSVLVPKWKQGHIKNNSLLIYYFPNVSYWTVFLIDSWLEQFSSISNSSNGNIAFNLRDIDFSILFTTYFQYNQKIINLKTALRCILLYRYIQWLSFINVHQRDTNIDNALWIIHFRNKIGIKKKF